LKVAVLTSSRADYGIYLPLLKRLKADSFFDLNIIAFGTHLSELHGKTKQEIVQDGFDIAMEVDTMPAGDSPAAISAAIGKTVQSFSGIWSSQVFDLVIALGDRYEMFAACVAAVPFSLPIAHLHGGETTLGAIDNVFRNSITQMANWHFTAAEPYANRSAELRGSDEHVYNVGALSIDNLVALPLLTIDEFHRKFEIDLSVPTILITFHPETVNFSSNKQYIDELIAALDETSGYQFVITMPNADTMGASIREALHAFVARTGHATAVESFGAIGYLSCMKYASMMLGNSSSGFIEAAFFPKYVINLGNRQSGRIVTDNIINCEIEKGAIVKAIQAYKNWHPGAGASIYGNGTAAAQIVNILKSSVN
jgi:GDP/UDP-N,N'-diacetylbacillosamine 2-epimerase (hydrolysing)